MALNLSGRVGRASVVPKTLRGQLARPWIAGRNNLQGDQALDVFPGNPRSDIEARQAAGVGSKHTA